MSYKCEICGKRVQKGNLIRHHRGVAGGRWKRKAQKKKRVWLPNLHNVRVIVDGNVVRKRVCTKCLRKVERPRRLPDGDSQRADLVVSKTASLVVQTKKEKKVGSKKAEAKGKEKKAEEKKTKPVKKFAGRQKEKNKEK